MEVVLIVIAILLVALGAGGPTVSVTAQEPETNTTETDQRVLPPHQNPDEITANGDLKQLETLALLLGVNPAR